jgi:hypothetical protein
VTGKGKALVALLMVAGGSGAHLAQRGADETRLELDPAEALRTMASGESLRVAASGFHLLAADVLWIQATLVFGDFWTRTKDPLWTEWLYRMIEAVVICDPEWRTPYVYGGSMLEVVGAVELADEIYLRGRDALPDEFWFSFALGMNAYMEHDDSQAASSWLKEASSKPGAPGWYAETAVALAAEDRAPTEALGYLRDQLAVTTDEGLRESLVRRIARVEHEDYSLRLTAAREQAEQRLGRPVELGEFLEQLGERAPLDPLGGRWVEQPGTRTVVSSVVDQEDAEEALRLGRKMMRMGMGKQALPVHPAP